MYKCVSRCWMWRRDSMTRRSLRWRKRYRYRCMYKRLCLECTNLWDWSRYSRNLCRWYVKFFVYRCWWSTFNNWTWWVSFLRWDEHTSYASWNNIYAYLYKLMKLHRNINNDKLNEWSKFILWSSNLCVTMWWLNSSRVVMRGVWRVRRK